MKFIYELAVFMVAFSLTLKVGEFVEAREIFNNRFFTNKLVRFLMFIMLFCFTVMMKVSVKEQVGFGAMSILYNGLYFACFSILIRWSGAIFSSRKGRRGDVVS